ncbi:ubiquitin elongating factor core-domain-containing protein [Phakopsora pachyrhizi]|uniref:RING-type E3 ubiquitin transferase n=1 Tax=Phakopsora pachyrhizi TaxID=170000 RepID=A0AAV0BHN4_PHAPC|nr:ubiquitin elongating factor core-domain-containing protein [Phakopsora pachyrhizi]
MTESIGSDDVDQIRLKRILRLQRQQESEPDSNLSSDSSNNRSVRHPQQHQGPISLTGGISRANQTQQSNITINLSADQLEQWQHRSVSSILRVTLDQDLMDQQPLVYLSELRAELEDEEPGSSKRPLSIEIFDRLLVARLSIDQSSVDDNHQTSAFRFLTGAWLRAMEERSKALASRSSTSEKLRTIERIKVLISSYIGLVIQDPTMFPIGPTQDPSSLGTTELVQVLIDPSPSDPLVNQICSLLNDLSIRFENDGLEEVIGPALTRIAMDPNIHNSNWHLANHQWRNNLRVLEEMVQLKQIARILPNLSAWSFIENFKDGRQIEFLWLFGPLMSLSAFPDRAPQIALEYFSNPSEKPRADLNSATLGLQGTLNSIQLSFFNIFDRIVRAGPAPREAVLKHWAKVIELNSKRAAIQVDRNTVSSDGLMINTQAVLLQFAGPFLDYQCSKIDKVDPLYFKKSNRLEIRDETKINATKEESDAFFALIELNKNSSVNFVSEIFFLNVAIFRLGILSVSKNWDKKARDIDDMKKELVRAEADRRWDGTPQEAIRKSSLEKFKKEINKLEAELVAYEVQMCDPEFLTKCNSFCSFVMTWCVRMVDPLQKHPQVQIKLPLPRDCPIEFKMLPEYVLEDVIEFYSFISRHSPSTLLQASSVIDELLTFTLAFLTTPYLKNYHLKSKFIEILYYNTVQIPGHKDGILGDSLNYHPLALSHLMSALMQIYVEVEITGSHTQFYDKYIALILRKVWHNQTHRTALKRHSTTESFVRFANLLMNDVTYLLDDTLGQLQEVNRIETKMADQESWMALSENERKEEEGKLLSCERHCPSFLSLANENVNMLKTFTEETPDAFLKSEIVNRLAAMLDYNLNTLVGPKCQTLKIKDPKKYHFQPKILLSDLIQVYINLWDQREFQEAISNDGRSYDKDLFERADRICRKANLKSLEDLERLKDLVLRVEEIKKLGDEEEEELGEVPDEFLDPLMATIMKEPVILPTSKTTVDLSTIKQHFLSDETDPFNRMKLKIEDVIPDLELKAKINEWIKEKKQKK